MDTFLIVLAAALSLLALAIAVVRWNVVRDRRDLWGYFCDALSDRSRVIWGALGALFYLGVYFVAGGRVRLFYGYWVVDWEPWGIAAALVNALLLGLLIPVFAFNLKQLGMMASAPSRWGILGTLFAVVASFCP
jgi:hypothetical protein